MLGITSRRHRRLYRHDNRGRIPLYFIVIQKLVDTPCQESEQQ